MTTSFLHPTQTQTARLINARKNLLLDKPFWGTTALRLILQEVESFPTIAGTNGKYLFFNPTRTKELNKKELKALIAHEVGHLIYLHHLRRNNRNKRYWNIAGDFVINSILKNDGFDLPEDGCIDSKFDGMNTEKVYEIICKESMENLKEQQREICIDDFDDDFKGDNDSDNELNEDDQNKEDDLNKEDHPFEPTHDQFGDLNDPDPGGMGMVEDWPGFDSNPGPPSPAEVKQEEQNWKIYTNQALQQANGFGNVPGGFERKIKELLNPKIDWNEQLRNFMYEKIKDNYTWRFPNKKFIQSGIYLPSLNGETIKNLVVAIDTSGSINAKQLAQAATELTSILETFSVHLHILYCDTEIANHEEFTSQDLPVKLNAKGFGGTDFRPPFDWVEENLDEIPICLIYITDLYCDLFPVEPEYPVLWVCTGRKEYLLNERPPFGEIIWVEM